MADGPNYEALFRGCKCLNGNSDLPMIVKWLRFTADEGGGVSPYLAHYLPMLPADVAAEFTGVEVKVEEKVAEKAITETVVIETIEAPKKKAGRLKKS